MTEVKKPTHGFTKHGLAVHAKIIDHMRDNTAYQRFNKKVALALSKNVGTMTAFWVFWILCLLVLPAVLPPNHIFPSFMASFHYELFMTWLLSTCFQLTLLPALMVGQNLQNEAADARSAKQFEDTEDVRNDMKTALDRLEVATAGGLKDVIDRFDALEALVKSALERLQPGTKAAES